MSLTLKVFYEKPDGNKEIRRFPLKTDQSGDIFKTAHYKIKQLYPALRNGNFQLYWKDSDGDRIVFSCSEEMQDAIQQVQDGVLRIYISNRNADTSETGPKPAPEVPKYSNPQPEEKTQDKTESPPKSAHHIGVICDGCEGEVYGIRYKCCVCEDYDLCEVCEGKGMHKQHDMFKITTPRQNPRDFLPPHMFGRQFHRFMRGFDPRFGGQSGESGSQGRCGRNREQFDQYLNNMGANIAAFLDPFGIDVTYDVRSGNGENSQRAEGNWGRGRKCGSGRGKGFGYWGRRHAETSTSGETEATKEGENREKEKDEMERPDKQKSTNEGGKPASNTHVDGGKTPGDCEPKSPMETDADQTEAMTTEPSSSSNEEWTFIPDTGSVVTPPTSSQAIPMPGPVPSAPTSLQAEAPSALESLSTNVNSTGLYPDLKIQQSLDQMLSMGFTNTDGWLSDLLTDHNGDIGVVLDCIKAKATQQLENLRGSR